MEKLKNLCGQIPEELHNKVRTEQESLGLTLGKYLEQVLTATLAELDQISTKYHVNFVLSVSMDGEELPESAKDMVLVAL